MGKSKELAELGDVVTQSGGNVGIGTSSPVAKLQIRTQTDANAAFQNSTSVSGGVKINAFTDAANASVPFELDGSSLQFNTAAVERMRIDASGRVTMPYQPAFSVYATNGQSIPATTPTKINFNAVEFNIGSHWSTSNYRFTAPVSGRYLFTFAMQYASGASSPHTNFYVNGATLNDGWLDFENGTAAFQARVINLSAGDYVEGWGYVGVNSSTFGGRDRFAGYLIG